MLYNKAKIQRLLLFFSSWLLSWGVWGQPLAAVPLKSPSVVVLAGGGAKGFAHLAVLRRLKQDRVPIAQIVGTSMGAVIGELYASGLSTDEIERTVGRLDPSKVALDQLNRLELPSRTESLIPTSSMIKGVLQNHTLNNDDLRVSFLLKIGDIADYPLARELILNSLKTSQRVLVDPTGEVLIAAVAASEVTYENSSWINDVHNGHKGLVSELLFDICMRFRAEGVGLAAEGGASATGFLMNSVPRLN